MIADPYKIIRKPLLTEKGTILRDEDNVYLFEVDREASRDEIRSAVEYLDRKAAAAKPGKDAAETATLRSKARREAWEDLTWALLNTKEFLFTL